jgi:hypothetical protein
MAGSLTISTLKDSSGVLATQNGMTGIAKAWVNFNGTGTVAIRSSFNVSSITDNGTGSYTVNFTTALPNTDYSALATCDLTVAFSSIVVPTASGTTKTTTACTAQFWTASGGADVAQASFAVFSS